MSDQGTTPTRTLDDEVVIERLAPLRAGFGGVLGWAWAAGVAGIVILAWPKDEGIGPFGTEGWFIFTALMASVAMIFIPAGLNRRSARTMGLGAAPSMWRQWWTGLATLPLLLVLGLMPIWLIFDDGPLIHGLARSVAGLSAIYLGWVTVRRLSGVGGWLQSVWGKPSLSIKESEVNRRRAHAAALPATGLTRWRAGSARRIRAYALDSVALLRNHGMPPTALKLLGVGDRDMHVRLTTEALVLEVYDGAVVISAEEMVLSARAGAALESMLGSSLTFEELGTSWQIGFSKWEQGKGALGTVLEGLAASQDDDAGMLHTPAMDDLASFTAYAEVAGGQRVRWETDGDTLAITSSGYAPMSFDLKRRFRLLISVTPSGAAPALQLLVRQESDEQQQGAPGAVWKEARLRVPLRRRSKRVGNLPEEEMEAPELLRPQGFRQLWTVLFWACHGVGGQPPDVPFVELAKRSDEPDAIVMSPVRGVGAPPSTLTALATLGTMICVVALLIGTSSSAIVWPILEVGTTGQVWLTIGVVALLLLNWRLWGPRSPSVQPYLDGLRQDMARIHDAVTGGANMVEVAQPDDIPRFGPWFESGRVLQLAASDPSIEGFSVRARIWPAGYRPAGACVVEQLDLVGSRRGGQAKRLQQIFAALRANNIPHETREDAGALSVRFETRRVVGGGPGAWHSLIGLIADTVSPGRVPAQVPRSVPDTLTPSAEITGGIGQAVRGRRFRGWKHRAAVVGLACSIFGFPVVSPDAYPLPADSNKRAGEQQDDYRFTSKPPDPDLARACPEGESLYSSFLELRCLANAADHAGDLSPYSDQILPAELFGARLQSVPVESNEEWAQFDMVEHADCADLKPWIDELGSKEWMLFVKELERRLGTSPPWSNYGYGGWIAEAEKVERASLDCGIEQARIDRAVALIESFDRLFPRL